MAESCTFVSSSSGLLRRSSVSRFDMEQSSSLLTRLTLLPLRSMDLSESNRQRTGGRDSKRFEDRLSSTSCVKFESSSGSVERRLWLKSKPEIISQAHNNDTELESS